MKPGDRLDPGRAPWWFKAAMVAGGLLLLDLWLPYFVNFEWVWLWLTGGIR